MDRSVVQVNLQKKKDRLRVLIDEKGRGMGKLNKMSLALITELASIRDELGAAISKIQGEGRAEVIHAYSRLADLTGNVTLLLGQFNLKNLLKFLKRRGKVD